MKSWGGMAVIAVLLAGATMASAAELDLRFGGRVDFGIPLDPDAYGGWVPGGKFSFCTPEFLVMPGLVQGVNLGNGIGIDLVERLIWVESDNASWDYELLMVPVTVTGRYQFFSGWGRPVNPYVGAGLGGSYYANELDGEKESGFVPTFHAVLGLNLDVQAGFAIETELRYEIVSFDAPYETRTFDPETEQFVPEFSTREVDGDILALSIGIVF